MFELDFISLAVSLSGSLFAILLLASMLLDSRKVQIRCKNV